MKKRLILLGLAMVFLLAVTGCSNPKRDAKDTNIQVQMERGTLNPEY